MLIYFATVERFKIETFSHSDHTQHDLLEWGWTLNLLKQPRGILSVSAPPERLWPSQYADTLHPEHTGTISSLSLVCLWFSLHSDAKNNIVDLLQWLKWSESVCANSFSSGVLFETLWPFKWEKDPPSETLPLLEICENLLFRSLLFTSTCPSLLTYISQNRFWHFP